MKYVNKVLVNRPMKIYYIEQKLLIWTLNILT